MSFSPTVVDAYRERGPKTLTRDLNVLRNLGLVERLDAVGYGAAKGKMRAFLPRRVGE